MIWSAPEHREDPRRYHACGCAWSRTGLWFGIFANDAEKPCKSHGQIEVATRMLWRSKSEQRLWMARLSLRNWTRLTAKKLLPTSPLRVVEKFHALCGLSIRSWAMRGPRVRVCRTSVPSGIVDGSAGAPASLAGADSSVVPLLFSETGTVGRFRPGRLRGRTVSPSTWWQNTAMAVFLVGRQCCVSKSAMERYDARLCRNCVMTSSARSKSWNFCGRREVNSSTALRTVAGSNEGIGSDDADVNQETGRRENGHDDAAARTVHCQSRFTINVAQRRVRERGAAIGAEGDRNIGNVRHLRSASAGQDVVGDLLRDSLFARTRTCLLPIPHIRDHKVSAAAKDWNSEEMSG